MNPIFYDTDTLLKTIYINTNFVVLEPLAEVCLVGLWHILICYPYRSNKRIHCCSPVVLFVDIYYIFHKKVSLQPINSMAV